MSAVEYCLANFGSIVVPETEDESFVEMYQTFVKDLLSKQLGYLQAKEMLMIVKERNREEKEIELLKLKNLSMSSVSSSGKLDSTSLQNRFLALLSCNISPPDGHYPQNITI